MSDTTTVACPDCGKPMQSGGFAIGCGPAGSVDIPLPAWCADPDCRRARDERAMAKAVASGLIRDADDPAVEPCPECQQGKHGNCTNETWNYVTDSEAPCPCYMADPERHHN